MFMLSVLFGLIGIVAGVLWLVSWGAWNEFLIVLQGSVPPFLILVGLVALAAGISSIKDKAAAKKEEKKLEEGSVTEESSEEPSEEKVSE
jgi:F0F1-type ATP synthase assembly protein I